jgi:hypothetical protein
MTSKELTAMVRSLPIVLASGLLILGAPAWAADQHHPAGDAAVPNATTNAQPSPMPMGGPTGQMPMGGMMGGTTTPGMMSMMGGGMMGNGAMPMMGMMTDHIEGRLAFLKTELKITETQTPQWDAFAGAVRASAKTMTGMQQSVMRGRQQALPARIEQNEKALSARLETLRKIKTAVEPLYAGFSEEQKQIADQLMVSPMGMLGMM